MAQLSVAFFRVPLYFCPAFRTAMAIDLKKARASFKKLDDKLAKVAKKRTPDNVHKFRTAMRRIEVLLGETTQKRDRNNRKLLKVLASLRKKAGKVRDLDVQITTLGGLKIEGGNGDKTSLLEALTQKRIKAEKKLVSSSKPSTRKEVHQRLRRAADGLTEIEDMVPLALALNLVAEVVKNHSPLNEKSLHQHRIVGKRARYLAELADGDPQAEHLVRKLKEVQDVIGDWHDWLKMTQEAQDLLGGAKDSALVAMLQNVTRAKYRQALDLLARARTELAKPARVSPAPERKQPRSHKSAAGAAA
jgi:CHAD domain-containing protein